MIMKIFASACLLIAASSTFAYFIWHEPVHTKRSVAHAVREDDKHEFIIRIKQKAAAAAEYIRAGHFNSTRCFLADMRVSSGKARFFVYNLVRDSIEKAGLVAHGSGSDQGDGELRFSNTINSGCTSLGRYRIGGSYYGRFGLAYKLFGLDETNSAAFNRAVVLHAHSCIPSQEVYPIPICESLGCPMVAPDFLQTLKNYIDRSEEPILLWIYY